MHNLRRVCISESPKDIVSSRSTRSILFLGKLGQRKGIYDLLVVVANLKKYFPEFKLFCCGDGELDLVAHRADILNIRDCVEILGWVSGKAKEDLLNDATIYVLPSYNEGLPVAKRGNRWSGHKDQLDDFFKARKSQIIRIK